MAKKKKKLTLKDKKLASSVPTPPARDVQPTISIKEMTDKIKEKEKPKIVPIKVEHQEAVKPTATKCKIVENGVWKKPDGKLTMMKVVEGDYITPEGITYDLETLRRLDWTRVSGP